MSNKRFSSVWDVAHEKAMTRRGKALLGHRCRSESCRS